MSGERKKTWDARNRICHEKNAIQQTAVAKKVGTNTALFTSMPDELLKPDSRIESRASGSASDATAGNTLLRGESTETSSRIRNPKIRKKKRRGKPRNLDAVGKKIVSPKATQSIPTGTYRRDSPLLRQSRIKGTKMLTTTTREHRESDRNSKTRDIVMSGLSPRDNGEVSATPEAWVDKRKRTSSSQTMRSKHNQQDCGSPPNLLAPGRALQQKVTIQQDHGASSGAKNLQRNEGRKRATKDGKLKK